MKKWWCLFVIFVLTVMTAIVAISPRAAHWIDGMNKADQNIISTTILLTFVTAMAIGISMTREVFSGLVAGLLITVTITTILYVVLSPVAALVFFCTFFITYFLAYFQSCLCAKTSG